MYGSIEFNVACVRRLYENAKRQMHSGIWLSVEEVEALLSYAPVQSLEIELSDSTTNGA